MGNDKLSIVSFNSSRKGLMTLSPGQRPSYLQRLFESAEPDICFLPGDDKYAKLNVIRGYGQFTVPHNDDTVLLYNSNRVSMKEPQVSLNAFGYLPGLDFDQLVVPQVEVTAPKPVNQIVKEFSMVSWKFDFFETASKKGLRAETLLESIITFTQRLAWTTRKPVLIGGEMKIDFNILKKIVERLSHKENDQFLAELQPILEKVGYLPSMTEASSSDLRKLFMMKVFRCQPNNSTTIVNTWEQNNNRQEVVSDCFIASKNLQLAEASLLDVEQVTGRQISMPLLQTYRPTQTHIDIPVRPPKHSGG